MNSANEITLCSGCPFSVLPRKSSANISATPAPLNTPLPGRRKRQQYSTTARVQSELAAHRARTNSAIQQRGSLSVPKPIRRRSRHSPSFKSRIVAACEHSGASVARVALEHGLNDNMVRRWIEAANTEPAPVKPVFAPLAYFFRAWR